MAKWPACRVSARLSCSLSVCLNFSRRRRIGGAPALLLVFMVHEQGFDLAHQVLGANWLDQQRVRTTFPPIVFNRWVSCEDRGRRPVLLVLSRAHHLPTGVFRFHTHVGNDHLASASF